MQIKVSDSFIAGKSQIEFFRIHKLNDIIVNCAGRLRIWRAGSVQLLPRAQQIRLLFRMVFGTQQRQYAFKAIIRAVQQTSDAFPIKSIASDRLCVVSKLAKSSICAIFKFIPCFSQIFKRKHCMISVGPIRNTHRRRDGCPVRFESNHGIFIAFRTIFTCILIQTVPIAFAASENQRQLLRSVTDHPMQVFRIHFQQQVFKPLMIFQFPLWISQKRKPVGNVPKRPAFFFLRQRFVMA